MSLDRIINMFINAVVRRFVNMFVDIGFRAFSRRGRSQAADDPAIGAAEPLETAAQDDAAQRAKTTARMIRKLGR